MSPPTLTSPTDLKTLRLCSTADLLIQRPRRSWAYTHLTGHMTSLSNPSLTRLLDSGHLAASMFTVQLPEGASAGTVLFITPRGHDTLKV